jgi:hypothetical protein
LTQVTEVPSLTVSVAGANANPSMVIWLPLTGAAGAVTDGVAVFGPKVTEGCAAGREAEHPASNSTPAANPAARGRRSMAIVMPRDSAAGYTPYAG